VPLALRCKRVEEDLRPRQRVAAVVVITRRRDDAQIRLFSAHQVKVEESELSVSVHSGRCIPSVLVAQVSSRSP
jgi:hypothetical protein